MSEEDVETTPQAPTGYVQCPVSECGAVVKSKGQYTHFRNVHPDLDYQEYRDKFIPAPPPAPTRPPEEAPLYKGELDTTSILRDILSKHPDIPKRAVDEICSWSDYGPIHPTQLIYLLSSIRGVSTTTANVVAQKYSLALQKAQAEGRMQLPPAFYYSIQPQGPTPQMGPWPTLQQPFYLPTAPQVPSGMVGQQTAPQPGMVTPQLVTPQLAPQGYPFLTREEYEKKEKERAEKTEMTNLRDRVDKLDKDFAGALSGLEERLLEKFETVGAFGAPSQFEEVKEYIDKKGEICDPEKAVSVRVRRIPITAKESTEVKELREEIRGLHKTIQDKEVASLKDEIKELKGLISKKPEGPEESSAFKELKTRLDQAENRYGELKEKIEAEDRKRLEDTIKDLRDRMDALATRPAGEYKSDEYRLLADAIHGLQRTLEAKKPVEVIERVLTPGAPQVQPPPSAAGEVERGGVLEELRGRGLVRTIVERRR